MAANGPIDRYLSDLRRRVATWHRRPGDVVAEASDHLRERAELLTRDGSECTDAEARAIAEYGTTEEIADAHLRAARRPAIPTNDTRILGVVAMVAGLLWITLPLMAIALPSDSTPVWLIMATLFHGAVVTSAIVCVGLWLRHGGLGPLAMVAAAPALLAAPFVLFVWPIPAWMVLLGLAFLLFGLSVVTRRVAPLSGSLPFTFGLAIAGAAVLGAELFAPDPGEDFAFLGSTPAIAAIVAGLVVFGLGLIVVGRWMRSESRVAIPPLPAPTTSRPATT